MGFPRDTKSNKLSMRPILSPTGTYNFNLASWLEETNQNHLVDETFTNNDLINLEK